MTGTSHDPLPKPGIFHTLRVWLDYYINGMLDFILTPRCVSCHAPLGYFCHHCIRRIQYIQKPYCLRCGQPLTHGTLCHACRRGRFHHLDMARAVAVFSSPLREAIHHFKYRHNLRLMPILGDLMAWRVRPNALEDYVLVPVPLHPSREKDRGYNQAALLARHLGKRLDLPVLENALIRAKETQPQVTLGFRDRMKNVRDAFTVALPEQVRGRHILLIDDVMTTGSTLEASARALKEAGAEHVRAYVLARALYKELGRK